MPLPSTADDFLEIVAKSGVVDGGALETYLRRMRQAGPLPDCPKTLAAAMVRDGLLTRFQAGQFRQGKWRGFWICGKYKLLEHLGVGGMGNVFLCEHQALRRRVAVKVLPLAHAQDPAAVERFYREARAAAALDHPNIVRAYDVDRDGRYHFLVLEYVQGASFQEIVRRGGPMDATRAAHYVRQAALGLHHAHVAGVVHRDVKPANLLVDRQGVVKILDMGLARFFHDQDDALTKQYEARNILGTADYLAPEQAMSSDVDIRADVYSLGATFYFLLTARPPFPDGGVAQKLLGHQMREPEPLRELRPDLPEELVRIVGRMMAKDPAARFQAPAEVYEALAPWTQTPIPPPAEEEMPKSGVRLGGGGSSDGRLSTASMATPTTLPWITLPPVAPSTPTEAAAAKTPAAPRPFLRWAVAVTVAAFGGALCSWAFGHILTASEVRPPSPAPAEVRAGQPNEPRP